MSNQPFATHNQPQSQPVGIPVRTNLRAGLAWDDLDDQAKNLFNSLKGAISSAVKSVTGGDTTTTAS